MARSQPRELVKACERYRKASVELEYEAVDASMALADFALESFWLGVPWKDEDDKEEG